MVKWAGLFNRRQHPSKAVHSGQVYSKANSLLRRSNCSINFSSSIEQILILLYHSGEILWMCPEAQVKTPYRRESKRVGGWDGQGEDERWREVPEDAWEGRMCSSYQNIFPRDRLSKNKAGLFLFGNTLHFLKPFICWNFKYWGVYVNSSSFSSD